MTLESTVALPEREAARVLGISVAGLRRDRADGRLGGIPFARIGGRIIYPVAALGEWVAQRTVRTVTPAPAAPDQQPPKRRRGRPTKMEQLRRAAEVAAAEPQQREEISHG